MRDDLEAHSYQRRLGDGATLWHAAQLLRRHARVTSLLVEATRAVVLHCDDDPEECLSCTDLVDQVAAIVGMEPLMDAVMAHHDAPNRQAVNDAR